MLNGKQKNLSEYMNNHEPHTFLTILNWNVLSKEFQEEVDKLLTNISESDESYKEKITEDVEKLNNIVNNVNMMDFTKKFTPNIDNKDYF